MRTRKNRPVKVKRDFQGIAVSVERPMGTVVPWVSEDGTNGETVYVADYGFFPGKLAIDGDSLDAFVGPHDEASDAFVIAQCKAGKVEQPKVMLGFGTYAEARAAFDAMRWPGAYGGCARLTVESLRAQLDTWNGFLDVDEVIDFPAVEPDDEEPESGPVSESVKALRADDVTNFPKQGDNLKVSLRNSQWSVFDVKFMEDVKKNHPDVWALGGNIEGNAQFRRLVPIVKRGGYPVTETEEYAIRLREAWGARHKENKLPAGVVALGKWLVVGSIGESAMKQVINEEKAKKAMNDARKEFSKLVRSIAVAALAAGSLTPEVRDAILPFTRESSSGSDAAQTRQDGLHLRTIHVREVREDAREVDFVASTETVDSYGEIVKQNWILDRFQKNPVILFAHDSHSLPIGYATKYAVEGGALRITVKFVTARANPFAELCFQSVLEGSLRGGSVGFKPHTIRYEMIDGREICVLDQNELYEFSVCPVPSNPDGLAQLESRAATLLKSLSAATNAAPKPTTKQEGRMPDPMKKTLGDSEVEALRTRGMCKVYCECGAEMGLEMPQLAKMEEESKVNADKAAKLAVELEAIKKAAEEERQKAAIEKRKAEVTVELKSLVDEGKLLADDVEDLVEDALEKPERYAKKVGKIRERSPLNAPDLTKRPNLGAEPEHQRGTAGSSESPDQALISLGADLSTSVASLPAQTISDPDSLLGL